MGLNLRTELMSPYSVSFAAFSGPHRNAGRIAPFFIFTVTFSRAVRMLSYRILGNEDLQDDNANLSNNQETARMLPLAEWRFARALRGALEV